MAAGIAAAAIAAAAVAAESGGETPLLRLPGASQGEMAPTNAPATALSSPERPMTEAEKAAQSIIEEGFFQSRVGNHVKAIAMFEAALRIDPDNRRALFGLGTSYIATEDFDRATNVLERSIQLAPNDYFALNNLAWLLATARDIRYRDGRRAVRLAREALMIAPLDCHVWSTLAESYYVGGEYDKARRAAEEALRLARQMNIPPSQQQEYAAQARRCRAAEEAMNILE